MFHAILSNFDFWIPTPNIKEILENTRFGLMDVWTEKIFFKFFLIQIFSRAVQAERLICSLWCLYVCM